MNLGTAFTIASRYLELLAPHCEPGQCEIAGSIRRRKAEIGDIEIVCVPKPYDVGLFISGIATVINRLEKVKGELGPDCKYTQRLLPEGIALDLFICTKNNFANNFTIRTGSAEWVHRVLATRWVQLGYKSEGAILTRDGEQAIVSDEASLFALLGMKWVEPWDRK